MFALSPDARLVQQALTKKGIETPMSPVLLDDEQRKVLIEQKMYEVLELLGLDLRDDSLEETPKRVAKMFIDEIFSGLDYQHFPKITKIKNQMQVKEMVVVKDISLTSTCEHHLVTIDGKVSIAYYPKDWVLGLSKFNRIVDFFAKRPQVQERLTQQILVAIQTLLDTEDVAVWVKATHYCVKGRGIRDTQSETVTTAFGGVFLIESHRRQEFFTLSQMN